MVLFLLQRWAFTRDPSAWGWGGREDRWEKQLGRRQGLDPCEVTCFSEYIWSWKWNENLELCKSRGLWEGEKEVVGGPLCRQAGLRPPAWGSDAGTQKQPGHPHGDRDAERLPKPQASEAKCSKSQAQLLDSENIPEAWGQQGVPMHLHQLVITEVWRWTHSCFGYLNIIYQSAWPTHC